MATAAHGSVSTRLLSELFLVTLGVAAISLSSWMAIPIGPVPVTLQTLTVLVLGATYGTVRAPSTVSAWLVLGACGAPVFAGGAGGVVHLIGKTGGYILAFVPATAALAWLGERGLLRRTLPAGAAFLAAHALILAAGAGWLSLFIGASAAWTYGVLPFLLGALLKSIVGAALLPPARRWFDRHPSTSSGVSA